LRRNRTIGAFAHKVPTSINTPLVFANLFGVRTVSFQNPDARLGMRRSMRAFVSGKAPNFGSIRRSIKVSGSARHLASQAFRAGKLTRSAPIVLMRGSSECLSDRRLG